MLRAFPFSEILKVSELPPPSLTTPEIKSYEWHINTKYYSTNIHLSTTDKRTIGDKEFAESVEAFIHYFDPCVVCPSYFIFIFFCLLAQWLLLPFVDILCIQYYNIVFPHSANN